MKKNISINISGMLFHVEEDGYDILRKYLDSIHAYFSSFEDSSEILTDIESRIAEILLMTLSTKKEVITQEDINSVMEKMGSVHDFREAAQHELPLEEENDQSHKQESETSKKSSSQKRLYRDKKRKILGGVCAGLGHYFNIDSVWPRLLFTLLVLMSYGSLVLIYVILWIAMPASEQLEDQGRIKRMFRDPENKVLGGVASGVASFVGIGIVLSRILFVLFTLIGGAGFLVYLVLWFILPEAKSITEKMQMQGEPITLSNIESSLKKKLGEKEHEEERLIVKIILFPFRLIALIVEKIAILTGPLFSVSAKMIRLFIGIGITLVGLLLLLCVGMIAGIGMELLSPSYFFIRDTNWESLFPVEVLGNTFTLWIYLPIMVMLLVLSILVTISGISLLSNKMLIKPAAGWSMLGLFIISTVVLGFNAPRTIASFSKKGIYKEEIHYPLDGKIPALQMQEAGSEDYGATSLKLIGYAGHDIRIVMIFEARGRTRKEGYKNAQMIAYSIEKEDRILTFDSHYTFKKEAVFRAQQLHIECSIPFDQPFEIDEELWRIIDNDELYCGHDEHAKNIWQMSPSGLVCLTCMGSPYENSTSNSFSLSRYAKIYLEEGRVWNHKQKVNELILEGGKEMLKQDQKLLRKYNSLLRMNIKKG